MKRAFSKILILIVIIAAAIGITACVDRSVLPDDYIEAESLRVEKAEIYLSPSGETSKYQLEVTVLPEGANNALDYYIPSQYLEYVTVSKDGLIQAKAIPTEYIDETDTSKGTYNPKIPLTVTSASNKNATLTIILTIEEAEVKRITFSQTEIELIYNGESVQLEYEIEPYHAQDGRDITFSSLDESIATVSDTGVVTPISAGYTTITAEGKTKIGKVITGRVDVHVRYGSTQYEMMVLTSGKSQPKYKQTINEHAAITFRINIPPQADPNPRIQWYVGTEKQIGEDGKLEFEHIPNWLNPQTYKVKAVISPKDEKNIVLYSSEISVYNDFSGFEFVYANNNKEPFDNYIYGQETTFHITKTAQDVDHYSWYLKRTGDSSDNAVMVKQTNAVSPDLTVSLNLDGDYVLTAKAYDSSGTEREGQGQEFQFQFNVNRYILGDTLVILPEINNNGIPPEIFNYYLHKCDANGSIIPGTRINIGSVAYSNNFYYTPDTDGDYIIEGQGILNGVTARVDGVEFSYYSDKISIYQSKTSETTFTNAIIDAKAYQNKRVAVKDDSGIRDVVIDGINRVGVFTPIVYWSNVSGLDSYWVEITNEKGDVKLLNSTESDGVFGDYYCILPVDFVDFTTKFKVRIKQKGGVFSNYYCYGYEAKDDTGYVYYTKIDKERHKYYLSPIYQEITNGYVRNMRELGDILDYLINYEPGVGENSLVTTRENVPYATSEGTTKIYERQYSIKIYIDFDFADIEDYYPFSGSTGTLTDNYINLYKSISGAQYAYCETAGFPLQMVEDIDDGGFTVIIYKNLNSKEFKDTDTKVVIDKEKAVSDNYSKTPYGENYDSFAIYQKESIEVWTTDQMYVAAENGKNPLPQSDAANKALLKAKRIIREIIGADMTDQEKVAAFYDYLILNTVYELPPQGANNYNYNVYHLEGVFNDNKAVCDGLSKAMSLLCAMEGIPCYKVSGYVNGSGHAWNKIYVDGNWYNCDVTWGSCIIGEGEYINHTYMLMSDKDYAASHSQTIVYGEYDECTASYNYYKNTFINGYDLYIESDNEFIGLLNSFGEFEDNEMIIMQLDKEYLKDGIKNIIDNISLSTEIYMKIEKYAGINGNNCFMLYFQNK